MYFHSILLHTSLYCTKQPICLRLDPLQVLLYVFQRSVWVAHHQPDDLIALESCWRTISFLRVLDGQTEFFRKLISFLLIFVFNLKDIQTECPLAKGL